MATRIGVACVAVADDFVCIDFIIIHSRRSQYTHAHSLWRTNHFRIGRLSTMMQTMLNDDDGVHVVHMSKHVLHLFSLSALHRHASTSNRTFYFAYIQHLKPISPWIENYFFAFFGNNWNAVARLATIAHSMPPFGRGIFKYICIWIQLEWKWVGIDDTSIQLTHTHKPWWNNESKTSPRQMTKWNEWFFFRWFTKS